MDNIDTSSISALMTSFGRMYARGLTGEDLTDEEADRVAAMTQEATTYRSSVDALVAAAREALAQIRASQ